MCLCVSAPRSWLTLIDLKDPIHVFAQTNTESTHRYLEPTLLDLGVIFLSNGLHWSASQEQLPGH